MKRSRIIYLVAALAVVILGLASRQYSPSLPGFVASYAGDTLWALTAFLAVGTVFPRWSTLRVGIAAVLFAFAIELSQLYHAPWIDHLRHKTFGSLVLGYGFLWSDLVCYIVGVALGCMVEVAVIRPTRGADESPHDV